MCHSLGFFCFEELVGKRALIVEELVKLRDDVLPFIDLFDKEDVKKLLETDRLFDYFQVSHPLFLYFKRDLFLVVITQS
jgi:hypothetical protein